MVQHWISEAVAYKVIQSWLRDSQAAVKKMEILTTGRYTSSVILLNIIKNNDWSICLIQQQTKI